MGISESLTQQKLQEILIDIFQKGNQIENINMKELIEDIKQQILQQKLLTKVG